MIDLLGLVLAVVVTAACVQDCEGACLALAPLAGGFRRLCYVFANGAYAGGTLFDWCWIGLRRWRKVFLWIAKKPAAQRGFQVLPRRWVVERTFGWFTWWRRPSKDYERHTATSEALIQVVIIRLMLCRLVR